MWLYYRTLLSASAKTVRACVPLLCLSMSRRMSAEKADHWIDCWSRSLLEDVEPEIEVLGRENLEPAQPFIIMSNHQSLYDVPVLFQALKLRMRMLGKAELFRLPLFGPAMRASGFIPVERGNRAQAIQSIDEAQRRIESGVSVWIAPEGTRSPTVKMLPFKKGGFILAERTGVPILPVTVNGTVNILPARTRDLNRHARIQVTIHPRINPAGTAGRELLIAKVREAIASALPPGS